MRTRMILAFSVLLVLFFAVTSVTAQPLTSLEKVGKFLYLDENLSKNNNQSCATCHFMSAKFADPDNRKDPFTSPVSDGSDPDLFGGRNAPTAAYAGFSPIFHWDAGEGLFFGGLFWDGRASGLTDTLTGPTATGDKGDGPTGDPLADQAKGPFLNEVEMAFEFEWEVVDAVEASKYAKFFEKEFGPGAFTNVGIAYNNIAIAIAAFERSVDLNKFSSKFDLFVQEQKLMNPAFDANMFGIEVITIGGFGDFRNYVGPPFGFDSAFFSLDEADGLALFNADSYLQLELTETGANGGMCYACHLTENHVVGATDPYKPAPLMAGTYPPLFTDFSYDNLGIPINPRIAELHEVGAMPTDYGLGAQTEILEAAYGDTLPTELAQEQQGKFKVSTLRNIHKTAPYGHNGYFATLEEIVHFYNMRDSLGLTPEVHETVNTSELGNLGLTPAQEAKIVLFMKTLTDQ